jgi:gamma-glutamylputrescine oxidase
VLVAANAWLADLVPTLAHRVQRVHGLMLSTPPLGAASAAILPGRAAVFEESERILYFQKTADGRFVWGAHVDAADPVAELTALMHALVPATRGVEPSLVWQGALGITRDGLPRAGSDAPGLFWVGGYSGHGVALSTYLGHAMGVWMAGGPRPEWLFALPPLHLPEQVAPRRRFRLGTPSRARGPALSRSPAQEERTRGHASDDDPDGRHLQPADR